MSLSFLSAAAEAPQAEALVVAGEVHTYGDLAPRVAAAATRLAAEGCCLAPGGVVPRVGFAAPLGLDGLILLYALLELGVEIALLHPAWTAQEKERSRQRLKLQRIVGVADLALADPPSQALEPLPPPAAGGPRIIVQTSGSSGQAKGVLLSQRALQHAATCSASNLGWQAGDRWLLNLPLAHVGGLSVLTRCLLARSCVVLEPAPRFDPEQVAETIETRRVTLLSMVPTMLRRMLDLRPIWQPPASLRALLLGGAGAPPELLQEAADRGWPVLTTYGLTEACSQVATQPYATRPGANQGCGPPLPGVQLRIRAGGIEVRGPNLFTAYVGVGVEGPNFLPSGWFRTGDRGHLDSLGNLHILGRSDGMLISGGENVYPEEVEAVLERHAGISAACVFGHADRQWGQVVVAVLEAVEGPLPDGELAAYCRQQLAPFKCPKYWRWLDALPRTESGKKRRSRTAKLIRPSLRS